MNMSFGKQAFFGYQIFDDKSAMWFVNVPRRAPMTAAETRRTPAPSGFRSCARSSPATVRRPPT